jgi:hypothetical protein
MTPLKTLKGSKIWYSKFGVGKQVGSKVYIHISSHFGIIPEYVWDKAKKIMIDKCGFSPAIFNTLCYDLKKPHIVRFDVCEGFCTEREPVVGQMVYVDTKTEEVWNKYNSQIYHHKWLWVPEGFLGFDVQASYEWSKHWLSKLPEVASGYPHKWEEQLEKHNIV